MVENFNVPVCAEDNDKQSEYQRIKRLNDFLFLFKARISENDESQFCFFLKYGYIDFIDRKGTLYVNIKRKEYDEPSGPYGTDVSISARVISAMQDAWESLGEHEIEICFTKSQE